MKILFTSIGRRVELIQAFRKAAEKLGITLEIYGADMSRTAPALYFCDRSVNVPCINDDIYLPFLRSFCEQEQIDALIPTIDTDLILLSRNRDSFGGTKVIVSSEEKVAVCRDKLLTAEYFRSVGLRSPSVVDDFRNYEGGFPAFIKPKDGSSSIGAFRVSNRTELEYFAANVPNYIVQPFVTGTEFTVDIFCDFDGKPIFITPRIRLAVRSGEVLKTEIRQDETIIAEMKKLIDDFRPCGQISVQLIRDGETGADQYIEINPRFGGGAPLSMMAGADSAEAILRLLNGETLSYAENAAEDGAVFSRFDQSVRIR